MIIEITNDFFSILDWFGRGREGGGEEGGSEREKERERKTL